MAMKPNKSELKKRQKPEGNKNGVKAEKKKKKGSAVPESSGGRDRTQTLLYLTMAILVILIAASVFYLYQNNTQLLEPTSSPTVEKRSADKEKPAVSPTTTGGSKSSETVNNGKESPGTKKSPPPKPRDSKDSDVPAKAVYSKADITNSYDNKIRDQLDAASDLLQKGKGKDAMKKFGDILSKYPQSPRARFGLAASLGREAEIQRSNQLLEQSIEEFMKVAETQNIPMPLLKEAMRIGTTKMHFRGWAGKAAKFVKGLVEKYPDDIELRNKLGVCYLITGRVEHARTTFKEVLNRAPTSGFALVHYGFILKTADDNSVNAIPYLQTGIDSGEPGTDDGRFYFHLGDALNRVGRKDESYEVYEEGAKRGHFLSKYQRSLYNVNSLTGRPWWTPEQTTYQKDLMILEDNWKMIRDEGLAQMNNEKSGFKPEEENLREKGDWRQFTLWAQGRKNEQNCLKTPKTCALLEKIPDAKGCRRGQIKYSVMQPGVHVWPHCGPTNCRIRAHLGLVVPPGPKIRVAETEGKWKEGKFIIFDDSFEHEVWHEGESFRIVLIVDFWHPELTDHQKATMPSI